MQSLLFILLGVAVGALLGWVARGLRRPQGDARVEGELREQLRSRESDLAALRVTLNEAGAVRAAAETARAAAEKSVLESRELQLKAADAAERTQVRLETELTSSRDRQSQLSADLAAAHAQLEAERRVTASLQATFAEERKLHETDVTTRATAFARLTTDADELRARLAQITAELATSQAQLAAERTALTEVRADREELLKERAGQQDELQRLRKTDAEMEERIKFLNERLAAERQQIEALHEKFSSQFEAISNKLLVDSSAKFNQQSSESLERLLTPLRENLSQFKSSLDTTRQEAATHNALLKEQVSKIGSEAANLAKALKGDAKVLGNWGENMLDQLLNKSGLQRDVHYRRQHSAKDAEGEQRYLDVIIDLPEKRHLVIDSKVSLRHFEEAFNSTDDVVRADLLLRHIESTRKHFRDLGRKRYHETIGINAPDFVLMYVPIEAAYLSAIAQEPTLFEEALDLGVVLVTNSTLLPTLRTVSNVWRLADQQKNAIEIAERGGRLYDKFVGFVEDLKKVGDALNSGQQAWEAATGKLHGGPGNLVRQAEQLKALGVKASKALPPALVEKASLPELAPSLTTPTGVN